MHYISTRGNCNPVRSAQAINTGMVPQGGLFVPEFIPKIDINSINGSYQEIAYTVLRSLLTDYTDSEINDCIAHAYNSTTFDSDQIVDITGIGNNRFLMELYHGPTAAFKDMALQIMPYFLTYAKKKSGNSLHTVILVATSGDTGKAALEGFKNIDGISVIVFYPNGGVSEIQRLQMDTTDGLNTHVVSVRGNFDDCQTGVKEIFSDLELRELISKNDIEFSSANSINWGRLSPQIVYYFYTYSILVKSGSIKSGEAIDFCVPTGNFGNILAGYYAKEMSLPIRKLICASNKNNVLTDFFSTGTYNRKRDFHKTISPSMDILISSNLERFLFEISGHDAKAVTEWYHNLGSTGSFSVSNSVKKTMDSIISAGWVDETDVLDTINKTYKDHATIIDTHTAVGVAVADRLRTDSTPVVIASTASPYKFSCDVLNGMSEAVNADEFAAIESLSKLSGKKIHRAVDGLRSRQVRHNKVIDINEMKECVKSIIAGSIRR
ncbi:MAG: threonine synthase [Fibrobacter sp.]|nr:threonine synthase [Fibrobacter sp.]